MSKAFLVPKPGSPGKWRLVLDFRHLNTHFIELSFKYETLKTLRDVLEQSDWLLSLDLSDGFHAVPVAPEDRPYLTFAIDGLGYFQCAALPMGLSCSPYVFTKCMRVFVQALRSPLRMLELHERSAGARAAAARQAVVPSGYVPPHRRSAEPPPAQLPTLRSLWRRHRAAMKSGLRVLPYMDDFLFICRTRRDALQAREFVEALLRRCSGSPATQRRACGSPRSASSTWAWAWTRRPWSFSCRRTAATSWRPRRGRFCSSRGIFW